MTIDENLVCSFHVLKPLDLVKTVEKNKNAQKVKITFFRFFNYFLFKKVL